MIINTEQIQELLCNKNISTVQIQKVTGFHRKNVYDYRSGRSSIEKMQLQSLRKLQDCYNQTHDNLMKYKNLERVVEQFNGRYGQTEIFLDPKSLELKIVYDGIIGNVKENDLLVFDKNIDDSVSIKILASNIEDIL